MLSKKAVVDFLARPLRDSQKVKDLTLSSRKRRLKKADAVWHTEPRDAQATCLLLGLKYDGYVFLLGMGGGKALRDDEPVLMSDGTWKQVGSISPGDRVVGGDGLPDTVESVHPQGVKDLFEVEFSDGAKVVCCYEHLWSVQSAKGRKRTLSLESLVLEGLQDATGNNRFFIPIVAPVVYEGPMEPLPLDPYILGVLIGDGAMTQNCSITLGPKKVRVADQVMSSGLDSTRKKIITAAGTVCDLISIRGMRQTIDSLDLKVNSRHKHIPERYLKASVEDRVSLLYGMLDTDGCSENSLTWSTASEKLARQFDELVRSVGGLTRTRSTKVINGWEYHQRTVQLPKGSPRFRYREANTKAQKYGATRAIVEVTAVRAAQATCITVTRGLFVTRDFIVTHNTKLSLDILATRKAWGEASRMLVLVPNVINLDTWAEEVRKHAPQFEVTRIDQAGEDARLTAVHNGGEVVVCTYAGWVRLCSSKSAPGSKRATKMDKKKVDSLCKSFQVVIFDESTSVKNPTSLFFSVCRRMSRKIQYRYCLTGTPMNGDPIDLWSQFYLADHGETLGQSVALFRQAFFRKVQGYFGYEWKFDARKEELLARRVRNRSIRYTESECQDLPESVGGLRNEWMIIPCALGKQAIKHYKSVNQSLVEAQGDYTAVDSAYYRMRTLASGWLGARTDDGDKVELTFPQQPKMDALVAFLRELPEEEKVIVAHHYNPTGEMIHARLKKEKISFVDYYGKTSKKKGASNLKDFASRAKGSPRVLVASSAIKMGANLQSSARYVVFVESPDNFIDRDQYEARTRREGGLKGRRYYYEIVCKGTVDEKILLALKDGRSIHDVLVDGAKADD